MGIRDKPIAPASPWQNGFAERLIGSIRRECLDHIIVLGEAHLRRILKSYARYYNKTRTHLALDKDAPYHAPYRGQDAFFAARSSADCITNMSGFDFR
jgi:transposase InsO family protein